MTPVSPISANVEVLRQGVHAVNRVGPDAYAGRGGATGSPIGAHFRHVLDHYRCFLDGLAGGRIDYTARARDPEVESRLECGVALAEDCIRRLHALDPGFETRAVLVNAEAMTVDQSGGEWAPSSVTRELGFLLSHSIHHYALIAPLARAAGVDLGPEFGVAPSTLAFRKSLACAP